MIGRQMRPVAAAIDIGSNSIKMTVARRGDDGSLEQLDWMSEVVRLGQGLDESGRLEERRIEAAVAALGRFAERARELGAASVIAVATEATRAASNGPAFLKRVRRETGIEVRVLGGLEEARLTFRGLSATTDVSGRVVVADVGGGSTELIAAEDGHMRAARSIPLGSGRLTDRLIHSDPPTLEELAASEAEAGAVLLSAARAIDLPRDGGARLIVVGGTGEFMVRLIPNEAAIDRKAISGLLGKMAVLTAAELADAIEAPEARARVLPAGVAIVAAIADQVEPERIEVSRSGIRAGLLAEQFERWDEDEPGQVAAERATDADADAKAIAVSASAGKAARRPAIDKDLNFRDAMRVLIAERWAAVWAAIPAAIDGTDIEGVHDVRVASRRLRAAMDVAAPAFSPKWFKPLQRVAKEITGSLGAVRDRDVLLESLRAERAAAPLAEQPGIDRLVEHVEGERVLARSEMERYLRELINGPWAPEIARRFGQAAGPRTFVAGADEPSA